ncbi:MAG: hypothetical protein AB9907_10175 [Flexilinea sp.]
MFQKKIPLQFLIHSVFSLALSVGLFFSSGYWSLSTNKQKIINAGCTLLVSALIVFIIAKISVPFFQKSIRETQKQKKKIITILICTAGLAGIITWTAAFFFPNPLLPRNTLSIEYFGNDPIIRPTVSIFPFDHRDEPVTFIGTVDGIPGFAEQQTIGTKTVLTGNKNFIGTVTIEIPEETIRSISQIEWNHQIIDFSGSNLINLPSSHNPLTNQSAAIRLIFICLLIATFLSSFYILSLGCFFAFWSIKLITGQNPPPDRKQFYRNWQILYLFLTLFILLNPLFTFPLRDKIFFLFLIILYALFLPRLINAEFCRKYNSNRNRILVVLSSIFAAFTIFGNNTIILDQTTSLIPAGNIIYFFLACVWSIAPVYAILLVFEKLQKQTKANSEPRPALKSWFEFFLIFILIFGVYLVAYNPAISSMDSQGQWWQATEMTPIDDAHTPFHTLYLRLLIHIIPSPLFISIVQILFFAGICSSFLTWLYQNGSPKKLLILFTIFFAASPNNGLSVITIWKDIPFGISLLWLTFILSRIYYEQEKYLSKISAIAEITVCLLFVSLFRYNGLFAGIITAFILIILGIAKRNRSLILSVGLFAVLLWVIMIPIYQNLEVVELNFGSKESNLITVNDMIGIDRLGGTLSEKTTDLLNRITGNYKLTDYSHFEVDYTWKSRADWSDIKTGELLRAYGETIIKNPIKFLRVILMRTDYLWAVKESPSGGFIDSINWTDADLYGFPRNIFPIKQTLDSFCRMLTGSPFYYWIWRIGFYIGILIISLVFLSANHRKKQFWVTLPLWMSWLSLFGATYPTYRYLWPVEVIFGFLMFFFTINFTDR